MCDEDYVFAKKNIKGSLLSPGMVYLILGKRSRSTSHMKIALKDDLKVNYELQTIKTPDFLNAK